MINKIAFYDFDGTLIDTPLPEVGKPQWKKVTGEEYPHIGWWGRKESLDLNVFDIKAFDAVANKLRYDNAQTNTYTVILTSRMKKLQPFLEKILQKNGLRVDEMSPKSGGEDKDDRIRDFLRRFPDVIDIDLYDDREKEFVIFKELSIELRGKIKVSIYKADEGKLSLLSNDNVFEIVKDEVQSQMGSIYKEKQ